MDIWQQESLRPQIRTKSISLQSWRWAEALQRSSRVIANQGSHLSPSLIAIRSWEMLSLAEPHLPFFRRILDQFEEFLAFTRPTTAWPVTVDG